MAKTIVLTDQSEDVGKTLASYVQSGNLNFLVGSGASMPAINVAGNIEKEINDLIRAGDAEAANLAALNFIEEIEDANEDIVADIVDGETKTTFDGYLGFLSNVDRILFERKTNLLSRQANLFTTNYDMFFERSADALSGFILNDGFDRATGLTDAFRFAPEKYFDRTYRSGSVYNHQAEVPTFNLIKIHGSLSWGRKDEERIVFEPSRPAGLSDDDKADPKKVVASLKQRALILPNIRKFESTLLDRVYFDLLRLFSNALERENALLLAFGFSFADEHILDITRRALRNPTAQLIVFSYSAEGAEVYAEMFEQQRNVLIVAPEDDAKLGFTELNKLLASITPEIYNL